MYTRVSYVYVVYRILCFNVSYYTVIIIIKKVVFATEVVCFVSTFLVFLPFKPYYEIGKRNLDDSETTI